MTSFSDLLIICSGANRKVLEDCPTEKTKYTGIGSTVLLTAIMAGISGGYAIFFTFNNVSISILFGILWALIIFNLDRFIVSSIRKTGHLKTELKIAAPRILIAMVLAVTISKPLEVQLFNGSITKILGSQEDAYNKDCENTFTATRNELDKKKASLQSSFEASKNTIYQKDPIYLDIDKQYQTLDKDNKDNENQIQENYGAISKNKFLKTYTDLNGNTISKWKYNEMALQKIRENSALKSSIINNNKQKTVLSTDITNRKQELAGQIKELEKQNASQLAGIQKQIDDLNSSRPEFLAKCRADAAADKDILARLRALSQIKSFGNTVWWASLLITVLFILLETAPITVKLLSRRGPYDEILDRMEFEISCNQKKMTLEKNEEVALLEKEIAELSKMKMDIRVKTESSKIEAELQLNQSLLEDICQKVSELAKKETEKWYNEQLSKIT